MSRSRNLAKNLGKMLAGGKLSASGTVDADELQGQNSAYHLNHNNHTNVPSDHVQFNQDGDLAVTTGTARWYAPRALTISRINGKLATASNGTVGVALAKNGTSINTFNISASSTNNNQTGLSLSVAEGDYLTVNITAVGSTPGSDLSVKVYYS